MVQGRAIVTMAAYIVYRTAPFSMTLNDPKPRFQGQAILSEMAKYTAIVTMEGE